MYMCTCVCVYAFSVCRYMYVLRLSVKQNTTIQYMNILVATLKGSLQNKVAFRGIARI